MTNERSRLQQIAERAMTEQGFLPHPPPAAIAEVARLDDELPNRPRDLRALPWTSIDNPESQDLDQVEVCERVAGGVRLYVGIADVASYVAKGSATDEYAATNATSVYTGVRVFPMLPHRLCFDLTSLLADRARLALIFETTIDDDGAMHGCKVYPGIIENRAKLDYPSVSAWLDERGPMPAALHDPVLQEQVRMQDALATQLGEARRRRGALDVESGETRAVVDTNGVVTGIVAHRQDRAGRVIAELMIASNQTVARVLDDARITSIRRVVKQPERWPRIVAYAAERGVTLPASPDSVALSQFVAQMRSERPDQFGEISLAIVKLMGRGEYVAHRPGAPEVGHFGLAASQYTHSTAPNRRFIDLATQRLLLALAHGAPSPYSDEELAAIAAHASQREGDAQKVERRVQKSAAASLLAHRCGERFDAIVTGASSKGTFVRVLSPVVEGKIVRPLDKIEGLAVGDRVRVVLRDVSVDKGFIDFELACNSRRYSSPPLLRPWRLSSSRK